MADLPKALDTFTSDEDWALMSKQAGVSADQLKAQIHNAIAALDNDAAQGMQTGDDSALADLALSSPQSANNCISQDFEVSLFKVIGIKGTLKVCGSSTSDWTAELKVCLTVAGASVWCTHYTFNPHNMSVCFSPSVGVAKAKLCFGLSIHSNKICLGVSGRACYWRFGWKCAKFDEAIFCIPV